jgi:hypothetical protein
MSITNSPKEGASEGKSGCTLSAEKLAGSVIFFNFMKIKIEIEGKNASSVKYQGQRSIEVAMKYLGTIEADEILIQVRNDDGIKSEGEFSGKNWYESSVKFIKSLTGIKPVIDPSKSLQEAEKLPGETFSLKNQLKQFLRYEFHATWFSSTDVKDRYEKVHGNISLGTVSTYLTRMFNDKLIERRGNRNHREYRLIDQTISQYMEIATVK